MLCTVFGNTAYVVVSVATVLLLAVSLGAMAFGCLADRSQRSLALFGGLQIGIGLYAVVFPWMVTGSAAVYEWFYRTAAPGFAAISIVRLGILLVLLLPPGLLLGGTLPVLGRMISAGLSEPEREVGRLYGWHGVGAAVGCQNNNQILEADAAIVALAGTWEAAVFEFTSQTEPPVVRDLIEEGGSATLDLSINGAYTLTVVPPGEEEDVTRGFMVVEGSVLLVSDTSVPGETTAYGMSFDGDTLTLTTTEVGFDFNNDSVSDAATLRLVLERTQG